MGNDVWQVKANNDSKVKLIRSTERKIVDRDLDDDDESHQLSTNFPFSSQKNVGPDDPDGNKIATIGQEPQEPKTRRRKA